MLMRLIQNMSPLKITLFWEATFKWIILYPLMLFSQLIIGIITYNSFHSYYEVGTMENTLHRLIYSPPYLLEVDRCTIREVKSSNTPGMELTLFFFFFLEEVGNRQQWIALCGAYSQLTMSPFSSSSTVAQPSEMPPSPLVWEWRWKIMYYWRCYVALHWSLGFAILEVNHACTVILLMKF